MIAAAADAVRGLHDQIPRAMTNATLVSAVIFGSLTGDAFPFSKDDRRFCQPALALLAASSGFR